MGVDEDDGTEGFVLRVIESDRIGIGRKEEKKISFHLFIYLIWSMKKDEGQMRRRRKDVSRINEDGEK